MKKQKSNLLKSGIRWHANVRQGEENLGGDLVWLSTKPLILEENAKLLLKWISLFKVMECLTEACCLYLLIMIHIHPIINILSLKAFIPPDKEDPPQQIKQVMTRPEENEYEVREIMDTASKESTQNISYLGSIEIGCENQPITCKTHQMYYKNI